MIAKCLICGTILPGTNKRESLQWDWFTGYLRVTVHFCPAHKTNELQGRLLKVSRRKPEEWTDEERNLVDSLSPAGASYD